MRLVIDAIEGEFRRYKNLADDAVGQLSDEDLTNRIAEGNSVAVLLRHLEGNLKSRFTDFLTSDGEKPWRDREEEFAESTATRDQLLSAWEEAWRQLFGTLANLVDAQLDEKVTIRGVPLSVIEALSRSVAHVSYHVGQIVLLARAARRSEWRYLSIPPGGSADYNAAPKLEKPPKREK